MTFPRGYQCYSIGVLLVSMLVGCGIVAYRSTHTLPTAQLRIGTSAQFTTYIPLSQAQREKGLAAFKSLDTRHAMLLRFPAANPPRIWMKDMTFGIDILWLDAFEKVVHISRSVSPYDQQTIYSAPHETHARCVIELTAGAANARDVQVGDSVHFVGSNEPVCSPA